MKKILVVAIVALAGILFFTACQEKPTVQNLSIVMGEGKIVQEVGEEEEITGEFHRWEPGVLVVNKGDFVRLTVTNPRSNAHIFTLPDFGVATPRLEERVGTATVEFTADKAGVFQFKCGLPHDHEAGDCNPDHSYQTGYLVVLDR